jgi:hypothetical protein
MLTAGLGLGHRIGPRVGNVKNDDAGLIESLEAT